jgi:hypothetical protein
MSCSTLRAVPELLELPFPLQLNQPQHAGCTQRNTENPMPRQELCTLESHRENSEGQRLEENTCCPTQRVYTFLLSRRKHWFVLIYFLLLLLFFLWQYFLCNNYTVLTHYFLCLYPIYTSPISLSSFFSSFFTPF